MPNIGFNYYTNKFKCCELYYAKKCLKIYKNIKEVKCSGIFDSPGIYKRGHPRDFRALKILSTTKLTKPSSTVQLGKKMA